jgi:hypothetical protein
MRAERGAAEKIERRAEPPRGRTRHRAWRVVLVVMASVAAACVTAASAAADTIDQVQVNGASANADGTGPQVTVFLQNSRLEVTNKSSSYTDIKEIDGQGAPGVGDPVTGAGVGSVTADNCTVANNSFSCPGLSIPPGSSVDIRLSSPNGNTPGHLGSLNVIYDSIEVNGSPMNSHGKGLQVTAVTQMGSCPEIGKSSKMCLTVRSADSNGAPLNTVTVAVNSPPADANAAQISHIDAEFGFSTDDGLCGRNGDGTFECTAPFGVNPQEYGFDFSDPSFSSGLGDISVTLTNTPCLNGAQASFGAAVAKIADVNCTPPSHTKITVAKINQQKHTAFFKFKAKGTKKFKCELMRNGKRKFFATCTSPKPYASKLPKGSYVFYVDAINQGGVDPKPAKKKFTLK